MPPVRRMSILRRIWDYVIVAWLIAVTVIDDLRQSDNPDDK